MNNENIKEILDILAFNKEDILNKICSVEDFVSREQIIKLLDYITNLQTIEREYNAILSENAELENKITNLQEENERLKIQVSTKEKECMKLQDRIDKAIEYMNNYNEFVVPDANIKSLILKEEYKKIIDILQGKSDE